MLTVRESSLLADPSSFTTFPRLMGFVLRVPRRTLRARMTSPATQKDPHLNFLCVERGHLRWHSSWKPPRRSVLDLSLQKAQGKTQDTLERQCPLADRENFVLLPYLALLEGVSLL